MVARKLKSPSAASFLETLKRRGVGCMIMRPTEQDVDCGLFIDYECNS